MAQITITIPNDILDRVIEALCNGQEPTAQKAKQELIKIMKQQVKYYETQKAAHEAFLVAEQDAESNISLS